MHFLDFMTGFWLPRPKFGRNYRCHQYLHPNFDRKFCDRLRPNFGCKYRWHLYLRPNFGRGSHNPVIKVSVCVVCPHEVKSKRSQVMVIPEGHLRPSYDSPQYDHNLRSFGFHLIQPKTQQLSWFYDRVMTFLGLTITRHLFDFTSPDAFSWFYFTVDVTITPRKYMGCLS